MEKLPEGEVASRVTSFVGIARRMGTESMSAHGCRLSPWLEAAGLVLQSFG